MKEQGFIYPAGEVGGGGGGHDSPSESANTFQERETLALELVLGNVRPSAELARAPQSIGGLCTEIRSLVPAPRPGEPSPEGSAVLGRPANLPQLTGSLRDGLFDMDHPATRNSPSDLSTPPFPSPTPVRVDTAEPPEWAADPNSESTPAGQVGPPVKSRRPQRWLGEPVPAGGEASLAWFPTDQTSL